MYRNRVLMMILLVVGVRQTFGEVFVFKHTPGDKYRIVTEVTENVYLNGRFNAKAEILNKIAVEVLDVKEGAGLISGLFQVSEKARGETGPFRLRDETFTSRFWRDERGRYDIGRRYLMPSVRDVPTFPDRNLEPKDTWVARAEEVHDFGPYGVARPIHIPLQVSYTYHGTEDMNGVEVAVFKISYSASFSTRGVPQPGTITPLKIKGSSEQLYYWDIEQGRPYAYQDAFDYIYILSNGQTVEIEGTSRGRVIQARRWDKREVVKEIEKQIEERGVPDAAVTADEEGITITLENINFPPDSDYLIPSEREKLDAIAGILKKYADRDLLIIGHTALAGTAEGRQILSEQRAGAVGSYLLSKGVRDRSRLVYKGVGAEHPVADNSTEQGRKKNRRVEIKILEN